nr:SDR family NAD(P)-dependent oxidoreductase [Candidatus Sigynarchaeota archaeon]
MKALVTGPTGQIGTVIVETLVKRGNEVHCFVRKSSNVDVLKGLSSDKIHFVHGDLTDAESVFKAISDVQPDYVFHS